MTRKQFFMWAACCFCLSNGLLIAQQMPSVEIDNLVQKIETEIDALQLYKNRLTSLGLLRGNIKEFRKQYLNAERLQSGKLDDLDNILAILEGEAGHLLRRLENEEDIDATLKKLAALKAKIKAQKPLNSLLSYAQAYENASLLPKPDVEMRRLRRVLKNSEKNLFKNLYCYVRTGGGQGTVLVDDIESYSATAKDDMTRKLDKLSGFTNQLLDVFSDVGNSNKDNTEKLKIPLLLQYSYKLDSLINELEARLPILQRNVMELEMEEDTLLQIVISLKDDSESLGEMNEELTVNKDSLTKSKVQLQQKNKELKEQISKIAVIQAKKLMALTDTIDTFSVETERQKQQVISLKKEKLNVRVEIDSLICEVNSLDGEIKEKTMALAKAEEAKSDLRWLARVLGGVLAIALVLLLYLKIVKLREKNTLLREKNELLENTFNELNHRVKNNLRMIAAMVGLQARDTGNIAVKTALKEARGRLQAVAFLHGVLYKNRSLTHVDIATYATNLIEYLKKAFELENAPVDLKMSVENIEMESDYAIPIGVLINEVVTNAFKHAFKGEEYPTLTINLHKSSFDEIVLYIKDNGTGIPPRVDSCNPKSFGMKVIKMLVKKQLKGTFSFRNEGGAIFQSCLKFK